MSRKLKCFIIMPFSKMSYTDDKNVTHCFESKDLNYLYIDFIKKAAESFKDNDVVIEAKRFDGGSGNFMKGIVRELHKADLVIAEITGLNPNVMYELGIRHTLKNNTIMIAQNSQQIPSDLKHYLAIIYDFPSKAAECEVCYKNFEKELHKAINERLEKENEPDNPVRDFLEIKQIFKDEQRINILHGYISITNIIIDNLIGFIKSFNIYCQKAKNNDEYSIPLVPYNWPELFVDLLKNNIDKNIGKNIYALSNSLRVIEVNLRNFFKKLKLNNHSLSAVTLSLSNVSVSIYQLDPINNPIIERLKGFIKEWEKELEGLQS